MQKASDFSTLKLFRDCLRLADYVSTRGGNRATLREQVRIAFRRHQHEADPDKVLAAKEAAVRGLSNYMFIEAQRLAKEEVEQGRDGKEG